MPDANTPNPSTSPEDTTPKQPPKKSNTTLTILIIGILFTMVICLCSTLAYILVSGSDGFDFFNNDEETEEDDDSDNDSEDSDSENDENGSEDDEDIAMIPFSGTYIQGQHPAGWTIIEYIDGAGSNMLVEGATYTGLTGLKIVAPGNKDIFTMNAVSGIGGTDACSEYYEFSDSNPSYYTEIVNRSAASGVVPVIIDLTSQDYTYFNIFDLRTRRIGTDLYSDSTSSSPTTFDASCGIGAQFWWFDDLQFKADGMDTSGYELTIKVSATSAERITLDGILHSLEVK